MSLLLDDGQPINSIEQHATDTFYHHGEHAFALIFPKEQLVVYLSLHHGIKPCFYINLHEIKLVYCTISTRNQGIDLYFFSRFQLFVKSGLACPFVLDTTTRTDGGARYPAVIRFLEAEWAFGRAGSAFRGVAAGAGRHGAVTRL